MSISPRSALAVAGALLAGCVASTATLPRVRAEASEVRALWVLRTSLESPAGIRRMVASAAANGFNALFVQVRGRGDAYFNRGVELRAPALASQPEGFDPLAETLQRAKDAGLRVHAWINVNLVAGATELPASREHVVYRHPEWLMVPRELAAELRTIDVRSPEYVGRLARWTRANASQVEGLYVSPVHQDAAAHTASVVADLVTRYAVDGVHLDYIRYPTADFDYSHQAIETFRAAVQETLGAAERSKLDEVVPIDPFAYPDRLADEWRRFRQSRLTALVARLGSTVRRLRPTAIVSAAVMPDARGALADRLQDWRTWLENGFIDALCPMAYTTERKQFAEQIAEIRALAGPRPMWAGIGAYRLSPRETIDNIATARRLGADGVILFSYDSLITPPNGTDYLAAVGKAAFSGSW